MSDDFTLGTPARDRSTPYAEGFELGEGDIADLNYFKENIDYSKGNFIKAGDYDKILEVHPTIRNLFGDLVTDFPNIKITSLIRPGDDGAHGGDSRMAMDVRSKSGEGEELKSFLFNPGAPSKDPYTEAGKLWLENRGVGAYLEDRGKANEHMHFYKKE